MHRLPPSVRSLGVLSTLAGAAMLGTFALPVQAQEAPGDGPNPETPAPVKAEAPNPEPAKPQADPKPAKADTDKAPAKPQPDPKPVPPADAPKPQVAQAPKPADPPATSQAVPPPKPEPSPPKPAAQQLAPADKPEPVPPPVAAKPDTGRVNPVEEAHQVAPQPVSDKPTGDRQSTAEPGAPETGQPPTTQPVASDQPGKEPSQDTERVTPPVAEGPGSLTQPPATPVEAEPITATPNPEASPVTPDSAPTEVNSPESPSGNQNQEDADPAPQSTPVPVNSEKTEILPPPVSSEHTNEPDHAQSDPELQPGKPSGDESKPAVSVTPTPEAPARPTATPKPTIPTKPRPIVTPTEDDADRPTRPSHRPKPKPTVAPTPSEPDPIPELSEGGSDSPQDDLVLPPTPEIAEDTDDLIPSPRIPGPLPEPGDPIPVPAAPAPAPSPIADDVAHGPNVSIDDNVEQRPPEVPIIRVHYKHALSDDPIADGPIMLNVEAQETAGLPTEHNVRSVRPSVRDTISHIAVATQSVGKIHPVELAEADGYTQTSDLIAVGYEAQPGDTLHTIAEELFAFGVLDVASPEEALALLLEINEFPRSKTITDGEHLLLPLNRHRLPEAVTTFGLTASGAWTIQVQGNTSLRLDSRIPLPSQE